MDRKFFSFFTLFLAAHVLISCETTSNLSFTDYSSANTVQISSYGLDECDLPVFTSSRKPSTEYSVIGYCELIGQTGNRGTKADNVQKLAACACTQNGDAILIDFFEEKLKEKYVQKPTTTKTTISESNVLETAIIFTPHKEQYVESTVRALVIQYGKVEESNPEVY